MKKEWKIFLTAVMYFTRIRVPASIGHSPEYLQQAPRYFPLIGWIVGAICSLVFLLFSAYISTDMGILASMIAGLLTTGAFHEDGFADTCDGFGGGWTKEKILLIMKDSRIGVFGAIGLLAILSSKFLLLKELASFTSHPIHREAVHRYFILALFAGHSLSRLMPVLVVQWSVNVTDPEHSKSKPLTNSKMSPAGLLAPIFFCASPFCIFILAFFSDDPSCSVYHL